MRLKQKKCIVTGGTSGIGEAIVRKYCSEGANVIFCGRRVERGKQVIDEVLSETPDAAVHFFPCDVSKEEEVKGLAVFAEKTFGETEVLVNNAGSHQTGKVHETSPADWDRIMNIDVRGVYLCCHYIIPQMLKTKKGQVINISSVSGLLGDTDMVAYNTAKGAVTNMTRCMALDYAVDGIRVNAICPGAVYTDIVNHTFQSVPGAEQKFIDAYPVHYVAQPIEIANLAVFLASGECDFLTGVNIPIDGGITAHTGQPYMGNY